MVIYGHDHEANDALYQWLRKIGLEPKEWNELVRATGSGSPYTGDIVKRAFDKGQAYSIKLRTDRDSLPRTSAPEQPRTLL
jgi:hypothetical protein